MSAAYPWQETQWRKLLDRFGSGRFPHAMLLHGPPGLGKRAFAERLARAVLCRSKEADPPCGQCASCEQFAAGAHPDFNRLEREEGKKDIGIAQVRGLIAELMLTSGGAGRWKAAIIEPADRMNTASANALLKTLEEPPRDTLLMLVTAHPARLPATIRSRCQQLAFSLPAQDQALAWLETQGRRSDWATVLRLAGGAPLAARALADADFIEAREKLLRQLADLREGGADPLAVAGDWLKRGAEELLYWLGGCLMDLVYLRAGAEEARLHNPDLRDRLQTLAEGLDLEGLHRYLDAVQRSRRLLETTANDQLLLEALLICWTEKLHPRALDYLPQEY